MENSIIALNSFVDTLNPAIKVLEAYNAGLITQGQRDAGYATINKIVAWLEDDVIDYKTAERLLRNIL